MNREQISDLDKLATAMRKAAEKATGGEWEARNSAVGIARSGWSVGYPPQTGAIASLYDGEYIENGNSAHDAAYIVAAQPKNVLALLDERDRLKAENERLREALRVAESFVMIAVPAYARDRKEAVEEVLPTIRAALGGSHD